MNTKKLALLAQVLVLPVVLAHSPANAAPWTNPTGANERFEWSAGQNTNDLLGDPVNIAQGLFFTGMTGFRAEGGGGVGDSIVDLASAVVNTASVGADPLNHYNVREWGTWNIGGPQGAVNPEDVFAVHERQCLALHANVFDDKTLIFVKRLIAHVRIRDLAVDVSGQVKTLMRRAFPCWSACPCRTLAWHPTQPPHPEPRCSY